MTMDLDKFLAPIPGATPTGVVLRYETIYQQIIEARREEDASLPQGSWERPIKRADWVKVEELCTEALTTKSKDLQIALWLTEAWLYRNGLDGLVNGLQLVESLSKTYWETIHPQIEEGDIEYRLSPFIWINDNLSLALRRSVSIVPADSQSTDAKLTLADWDQTTRMENVALKDAEAAKLAAQANAPGRAAFKSRALLASRDFYPGLYAGIDLCENTIKSLEGLMQEMLLEDSPGLANLRETLRGMRTAVRELGVEPLPRNANTEAKPGSEGDGMQSNSGMEASDRGKDMPASETGSSETDAQSGSGPITSRADAFRRLNEAADYLMRIEPHSPCPYLVKRAVSWGNLPLTELLQQLVRNEGDLLELYGMLGIKPQPTAKAEQSE